MAFNFKKQISLIKLLVDGGSSPLVVNKAIGSLAKLHCQLMSSVSTIATLKSTQEEIAALKLQIMKFVGDSESKDAIIESQKLELITVAKKRDEAVSSTIKAGHIIKTLQAQIEQLEPLESDLDIDIDLEDEESDGSAKKRASSNDDKPRKKRKTEVLVDTIDVPVKSNSDNLALIKTALAKVEAGLRDIKKTGKSRDSKDSEMRKARDDFKRRINANVNNGSRFAKTPKNSNDYCMHSIIGAELHVGGVQVRCTFVSWHNGKWTGDLNQAKLDKISKTPDFGEILQYDNVEADILMSFFAENVVSEQEIDFWSR